MLDVIDRASRRRTDDSGAVLVTVVVVMFVGFIVATVIASSVLFTITSNVGNVDRTQAFIAAESGRDTAVAALKDGCVAARYGGIRRRSRLHVFRADDRRRGTHATTTICVRHVPYGRY